MIPLHNHFHACLDFCQDGIRIAGEIGVANVESSHIHDDTSLVGGGPERTRISDLFRVKEAL